MKNLLLLGLFGLSWATAETADYDDLATEVAKRMNETLEARDPIWSPDKEWSLPDFVIKFRNGYSWHVWGKVVTFTAFESHVQHDLISKFSVQVEDELGTAGDEPGCVSTTHIREFENDEESTTLSRSGNNLYLTFNATMGTAITNYTFDCTDNSKAEFHDFHTDIVLYNDRSLKAEITLKINHDGIFNCRGEAYSVRTAYNTPTGPKTKCERIEGYITINDFSDTKCPRQSWTDMEEFTHSFTLNFCEHFTETMDKLLYETANAALKGFNLCPK